ncbi:MAG TPA: hypothetical protein VNL14_11515 [Candidatus Acidoferrales bacterium]|nr:hypothetical protein [Candidatus Acidoferrales bacterium]
MERRNLRRVLLGGLLTALLVPLAGCHYDTYTRRDYYYYDYDPPRHYGRYRERYYDRDYYRRRDREFCHYHSGHYHCHRA